MKKIILIVVICILSLASYRVSEYMNQPEPIVKTPVIKKAIPVTYGIPKPHLECRPNEYSTPEHQQEIIDTAKEMARFNNTPDNTNNADYQALATIHNNLIAQYNTCTEITQ